ncbi:MAG: diaminopimelate decarboxylase family protein [Deltaproteobacteria bacterium]
MIDQSPGRLQIGGLDAEALAERFGTPLFAYDAASVRARYRQIRAAFRYEPSRVHFAAVCNPNLTLLRLLREEGCAIHANSPGDVFCALRAGYAPADIVLSGSNLGEDDLRFLFDRGVHVNVDSLDDLARACALRPGGRLGIRVHFDDAMPESRMGLREDEVPEALRLALAHGVRLTALHIYCGTHGHGVERYQRPFSRMLALAPLLPHLEALNLGGGFGFDYREPEEAFPFEALGRLAEDGLNSLAEGPRGRRLALRLEPGRALVAASAILLTRVRSAKVGRGKRYVGVDATVANLTSPAVHGLHRRISCVPNRPEQPLPTDVCGCTTYSRDILGQAVPLPEARVGDLLAIHDAGAYGYCMSSHFTNRPRPAEIFVEGGEVTVATRRETFEDLVALQA